MGNPTRTPAWAKGMEKLGPGIYADKEKALHICEYEVCAHFGVPYTEANAKIVVQATMDALRKQDLAPLVAHVEDSDADPR